MLFYNIDTCLKDKNVIKLITKLMKNRTKFAYFLLAEF